jgi:hypothetical protein
MIAALPGQVQKILTVEVNEEQADVWIQEDIAQRVEVKVAHKIGPGQGMVVVNADEPRLATPMGNVDSVADLGLVLRELRGNIKIISLSNNRPLGLA